MQPLFQWLAYHPYVLLFLVVVGAVALGRVAVAGYALGNAVSAIVIGASISASAAAMGIDLGADDIVKPLVLYLFMYGLGLRIGPSLVSGLQPEGVRFSAVAVACSGIALAVAMILAKLWALPAGAAAGILAGAMAMPAAIGMAEEAVRHGAFALPTAARFEDVSAIIAASYALSCVSGTLVVALLCKHIPRGFGADTGSAAKKLEEQLGVADIDDTGLTGLRPLTVRAYRLTNNTLRGWTVRHFAQKYPQFKVLNVLRSAPSRSEALAVGVRVPEESMALAAAGEQAITRLRELDRTIPAQASVEVEPLAQSAYAKLGAAHDLAFRLGDIVILGGRVEDLARDNGLIGSEVADPTALNVPMSQAEIVVTRKALEGRELGELRSADFAGQLALHHIERGGVPIPLGLHVRLHRMDVLFVAGLKSAVDQLAAIAGRVARPSISTDLLVLSAGMLLGFLAGEVVLPLGIGSIGLGYAGGLFLAGVLVSSIAPRLGIVGSTPSAARGIVEELGLVAFVAIVALDAGEAIVWRMSGDLAAKVAIAGFVAAVLPPLLVWAYAHHVLRMNPAVLLGCIAGTYSQYEAARESAREIGSSVPWIGFPVANAIAATIVVMLGYAAAMA